MSKYPDSWEDQIRKPFLKEWVQISTDAELRRETGELDSKLTDDLDILGVNHFYNIFEAHFSDIFGGGDSPTDELVNRQRKQAVLGWARQIKNIRDPALGHPGDEDISRNDAFVTLDAARRVLQSFDPDASATIQTLQNSIFVDDGTASTAESIDSEERYIEYASARYRDFFRDRFVHPLMEGPELDVQDSNVASDLLMVELVALFDRDSRSTVSGSDADEFDADIPETLVIPNLSDALADYKHIALMGEAGSGKTSALLWLASQHQGSSHSRVPIFVSLNRYDTGNFQDFLSNQWSPSIGGALRSNIEQRTKFDDLIGPMANNLRDYIYRGRTTLILDGLNELPRGDDYQERLSRLCSFVDEASALGNWVVIACRPQDYGSALRNLQRVEIRPLDDGRKKEFLTSYLGSTTGNRLWESLNEDRYGTVKDMVGNPFLLTALIALAGVLEGGDLPTSRASLLGSLATASIRRESTKGLSGWVQQADQEKMLSVLAVTMTLSGRTSINRGLLFGYFPKSWFSEPEYQSERIDFIFSSAVTERLLIWNPGHDGGALSFEHQLWQSYYTARFVADLSNPEWLALARNISSEQHINRRFDLVRAHMHDPFWRDTILLLPSMLNQSEASQYLEDIITTQSLWEQYLYRDTLLATDCVLEGSDVSGNVINQILDSLDQAGAAGIEPLFEKALHAKLNLLKFLNMEEALFQYASGVGLHWRPALLAADVLEEMGLNSKADGVRTGVVQNPLIEERDRREIAKELEGRGKTQAAIAAWSELENDVNVRRSTRREARVALRRLR